MYTLSESENQILLETGRKRHYDDNKNGICGLTDRGDSVAFGKIDKRPCDELFVETFLPHWRQNIASNGPRVMKVKNHRIKPVSKEPAARLWHHRLSHHDMKMINATINGKNMGYTYMTF